MTHTKQGVIWLIIPAHLQQSSVTPLSGSILSSTDNTCFCFQKVLVFVVCTKSSQLCQSPFPPTAATGTLLL